MKSKIEQKMKSEQYRRLLNIEYDLKELTSEDFDNTLMHFADLYHKERSGINEEYIRENAPEHVYAAKMTHLKKHMKEKKMTQKALSKTIGVDESTLIRNFKGRSMTLLTFLKIQKKLEEKK